MKRALRVLFWPGFLFGAGLIFVILTRLWFMVFPLWYIPAPTELYRPVTRYDLRTFGAPIRAGFAKRDITPRHMPWLGGYLPPHPALMARDRLWAKSLAFEDARGERVVLVSCDLVGMLPTDAALIKKQISALSGDHIFIMATHTHSGPDVIGFWLGRRESYVRFLRSQIADAVNASLQDLGSAAIRYGQGDFSGRTIGSDDNPPDNRISVMQVLKQGDNEEERLVTLVNWACHPDIVEGFAVSADFPYFLGERIHRRIGGETIFMQGAIGGVQPKDGDNRDKSAQFFLQKKLGEDLGDRVVAIMAHPHRMYSTRIRVHRLPVVAPFENERDIAFAVRYHLVPKLMDQHGEIATDVGRIDIGPLAILTVPGELFPKIWWRVKGDRDRLMIFGLADAEFGYILLPEDFGYHGKHPYHSSVSIGPTFGQRIFESLHRLVKE